MAKRAPTHAPFRLGVVTKLWRRPDVAPFVLRYFAGLQGHPLLQEREAPIELVCVAAFSPGDPDPAERVDGWAYVEAPNRPLSAKGNAAVLALEGKVDAVLNVGSDDLVSPGFIAEAVRLVESGTDMVHPLGLTFFDVETGRAMAVDGPRIGAGRVLSRALLDRLGWRPWPERGELPDSDMDALLKTLRGRPPVITRLSGLDLGDAKRPGLVVLDVKGDDNIASYEQVLRRRAPKGQAREISADRLWKVLGVSAETVEAMRAAYAALRRAYTLRALRNIPVGMLAEGRDGLAMMLRQGRVHSSLRPGANRVERGTVFECSRVVARRLLARKYAEVVEAPTVEADSGSAVETDALAEVEA